MAGILYDARRIKAYEGLMALGELACESRQWCDALWEDLIFDLELIEELKAQIQKKVVRTEKYTVFGIGAAAILVVAAGVA